MKSNSVTIDTYKPIVATVLILLGPAEEICDVLSMPDGWHSQHREELAIMPTQYEVKYVNLTSFQERMA